MLALKETEFLGRAGTGDIQQRLSQLCENMLAEVETRYPKDAKAATPPERVRALRYRIRRRLLDVGAPPSPAERGFNSTISTAFSPRSVRTVTSETTCFADPTPDRRAEMIMKLEEDLLGFPTYPVARSASKSPPVNRSLSAIF